MSGDEGPHIVITHNQGTKHPLVAVWLERGSDVWLLVHPTLPTIRADSNNQIKLYTEGLGETLSINVRIGRDLA